MRLLLFLLVTTVTASAVGQNILYFADSSKPGQHVPIGKQQIMVKVGVPIDLQLELRTPSLKERGNLANLVIDDYRYDTPNYFTDHRVPNVRIEVTTLEGKPVPFRVSSQGGGAILQYLKAQVTIEIGGDPKQIDTETTNIYHELLAKTLKPEDAGVRIEAAQHKYAPNQAGTYQIRAIYHPNISGKWIGEIATEPINVAISAVR